MEGGLASGHHLDEGFSRSKFIKGGLKIEGFWWEVLSFCPDGITPFLFFYVLFSTLTGSHLLTGSSGGNSRDLGVWSRFYPLEGGGTAG